MQRQITRLQQIIYIAFIMAVAVLSVISGRFIPSAYADTAISVVSAFERTNVYDDLTDSTVGGNSFDVSDFPHDENGKPQIISFIEFCYSYYRDNQSDYGLYIYVYNPQDKKIDVNGKNTIQFAYGNYDNYFKYPLHFLNFSTKAGYEGRFYKFRIDLTSTARNEILKTIEPNNRIYKVSGFELSYSGKVTDYVCASTYTYSGFAKGYGSELAQTDTLNCKVDGFDRYVTLDVRSTEWRSGSSAKGKGYRNQLNSVYFSVPDKYFTDYGNLEEITAEWYEYKTDWITITTDMTLYSYMRENMGRKYYDYDENGNKVYDGYMDSDAPYGLVGWDCITPTNSSSAYLGRFTYGYKLDNMTHSTSGISNPSQAFHYAFYSDKGLSDTVLDRKTLTDWIYTYKDKYSVDSFLDCKDGKTIPATLFTDNVDDNRTRGYNRAVITSKDHYDLLDYANNTTTWDKIEDYGFWNAILGRYPTDGSIKIDKPIMPLTFDEYGDMDKSAYSSAFYIGSGDIDEFNDYIHKAWSMQETPVLFRFAVTDYYSAYGTGLARHGSSSDSRQQNLIGAQETVFFDFDIIQLLFRKNNVSTVIPVVSSPIDIIGSIIAPPSVPEDNFRKIVKIVLLVILAILIIVILEKTGLLPLVIKGIVWIVCLPFKAIAALFKGIGKLGKKNKAIKAQAVTPDGRKINVRYNADTNNNGGGNGGKKNSPKRKWNRAHEFKRKKSTPNKVGHPVYVYGKSVETQNILFLRMSQRRVMRRTMKN